MLTRLEEAWRSSTASQSNLLKLQDECGAVLVHDCLQWGMKGYCFGHRCVQWPVREGQPCGLDPRLGLLYDHVGWTPSCLLSPGTPAHISLRQLEKQQAAQACCEVGKTSPLAHHASCPASQPSGTEGTRGHKAVGGRELTSVWCSGRFSPASR